MECQHCHQKDAGLKKCDECLETLCEGCFDAHLCPICGRHVCPGYELCGSSLPEPPLTEEKP